MSDDEVMHEEKEDRSASSEDSDLSSSDDEPKISAKAPPAASPSKKKKKSKKSQPGRYSQLVIDTIRKLGERNGSSLAKVYNEAKKAPWFDHKNGRTYLRYSIKALVQNDTLLQVKGTGANGSFKLNRRKLDGHSEPSAAAKPAPADSGSSSKKSHKKKHPSPDKPKKSHKKKHADPSSPKKSHKKKSGDKEKKSGKHGVLKLPKSKKV
ncbi:histone H1.10 [Ambystoma mexicanum]|uniref:histone H1.10 n=1 Tax=Ambystoma mexicanum TaxID=8296 RepID=UPI0037E9BA90